jgi:hypothetical protein
MTSKYTSALLGPLVLKSVSISEVMKHLGLNFTGGMHSYLSKRIKLLGLDTSHFLGQGANKGKRSPNRRTADDILVKRPKGSPRERTFRLRRALLEIGRHYRCAICCQAPHWNGKKLVLQINHKNGDFADDRSENLEFVCPNCHSQTETYGIQNYRRVA